MQTTVMMSSYGLLKFLVYSTWFYFTFFWFKNTVKNRTVAALLLGLIRLLLGVALGTLLAPITIGLGLGLRSLIKAYLIVYPAIRAVEWGIIWVIMARSAKISIKAPNKAAIRWWMISSIIISCLTDLPLYVYAVLTGIQLTGGFC